MLELTIHQIEQITEDVSKADVFYSHLRDDLIDHICCDVENEMQKTGSFESAYKMVKQKIGYKGLQAIQESTLLLIDKKYSIMKTTMKISGVVAPILMAMGALFKIEHWPAAGIMLLLGFFTLIFIFLPSAIYVNYKEVNNKTKKLAHISGFIGIATFAAGVLFKIQHWPGAGILIPAGLIFSALLFIPAIFISNYRQTANKSLKTLYLLSMSGAIIYLAGFLSKMMHWPGAKILLMLGSVIWVCLVLPLFVFYTYKEETSIKRSFIFLIIMAVWIIIPTTLLRLDSGNDYTKDFHIDVKETNFYISHLESKNQHLYSKIYGMKETGDSVKNFCRLLEARTNNLCNTIENVKDQITANKSVADILIDNGEARNIKEQFINYHEFIIDCNVCDSVTNAHIRRMLDTSDSPNIEGAAHTWEQEQLFSNEPILAVNRLLLLIEKARMAENLILMKSESNVLSPIQSAISMK